MEQSRGRRDEATEGGSTVHCIIVATYVFQGGPSCWCPDSQMELGREVLKIQYRSYINILVAVATFYGFVAVWFLLGVSVQIGRCV